MGKFNETFISDEDQKHLAEELSKWESDPNYAFDWSERMTKKAALVLETVIDNAKGNNAANHILSAVDKITKLAQVLNELNKDRLNREIQERALDAAHQKELDRVTSLAEEKGRQPEVLKKLAQKKNSQES